MRIGLIADTHIPQVIKELPYGLIRALEGVDLILHAGDVFLPAVLDELENISPVLASVGDDDSGEILSDSRVSKRHVLEIDGNRLWLVHKKPYVPMRSSWLPGWWQDKSNPEQDRKGKPDIIIFGHEHRIFKRYQDGVLFYSPGSPTFLNYKYGLGTIGILNLSINSIEVDIAYL